MCEQKKKNLKMEAFEKDNKSREKYRECVQPPPPNINFGMAVWVKDGEKQISQNVLVSATTYLLYLEYFRGSVAIMTLDRFRLIGTLNNIHIYLTFLPSVKIVQLLNELLKMKYLSRHFNVGWILMAFESVKENPSRPR